MIIQQSRILSLDVLQPFSGKRIILTYPISDPIQESILRVGFPKSFNNGDTILPKIVGPVSRRNAEGFYIKHKDQEKETHYRTVEWTWKQWRGRDDYEEITDFKDVPYQRYPRTFIPPFAFELTIAVNSEDVQYVVSPVFEIDVDNNPEPIKHAVNLFLELFGECEIQYENLEAIIQTKLIRLNWEILPRGEFPWETRYAQVKPFIERARPRNQPVVSKRLETINSYLPDFVAIGINGFSGYMVFGFDRKNLYVFESTQVNNATYLFDRNWKDITVLTKKEILSSDMQKDRIIHLVKSWNQDIMKYLQ